MSDLASQRLQTLAPLFADVRSFYTADGQRKVCYVTRHEARLARRAMRRHGARGLSIYACKCGCGGCFLGHRR